MATGACGGTAKESHEPSTNICQALSRMVGWATEESKARPHSLSMCSCTSDGEAEAEMNMLL